MSVLFDLEERGTRRVSTALTFFSSSIAGHEIGNLPEKIEDQQKAVITLEKALVKVSPRVSSFLTQMHSTTSILVPLLSRSFYYPQYLKGDKLGAKRPTVRMGPWWKFWGPKRVSRRVKVELSAEKVE